MPASGSSATVKGLAGTVFGCQDVANIVLWELNGRRTGKQAVASDEQGMEVSFAIYGGRIAECDGRYLYTGQVPGTGIGTSLGVSVNNLSTGTMYLVEFGLKQQHENFVEGEFKAVALDGV